MRLQKTEVGGQKAEGGGQRSEVRNSGSPPSDFRPPSSGDAAFTLIEMLVVLVIIGILAAIALPALKGLGQSNTMTIAIRQMLDDVAYARQKALNDHTTIYMVFLPPEFWNVPSFPLSGTPSGTNADNLIDGQYSAYVLYSGRSIGDQPGKPFARYLTEWQYLPNGIIIETNKFFGNESILDQNDPARQRQFPVDKFVINEFFFPPVELTKSNGTPFSMNLPCIGFNSRGQLISGKDEYIPLARGSVFAPRDANDNPLRSPPDVIETAYREPGRTNYTLIRIDWLTGRAKVERIDLQ